MIGVLVIWMKSDQIFPGRNDQQEVTACTAAPEFSRYNQHMQTVVVCIFFIVGFLGLCGCDKDSDSSIAENSLSQFVVPVDGKLQEKRVAQYITIRQQINREMKSRTGTGDDAAVSGNTEAEIMLNTRHFDDIEKAVAVRNGMSYSEYLWVKETLITTQTQMWLQRYYELNNKIVNLLDGTLSRYHETSDSNDKQERQKMDGYVEEMKQELSRLQERIPQHNKLSEAFLHNRDIVEKFKTDLDALN